MKFLEFRDLSFSYGDLQVLSQLNFNLQEGEFVSLLGPSGSGKSTIFKILTGFLKNFEGQIEIEGESLTKYKKSMSLMMQENTLLPFLTLKENLLFPFKLQKEKLPENMLLEYSKDFGLKEFLNYYPHKLSGGMLQRANLLRAYFMKGDLMLLDEPFSMLDYLTKIDIYNWVIKIFEKYKKTFLMITHDVEEAIMLSDKVVLLSQKPAKILSVEEVDFEKDIKDIRENYKSSKFIKLKDKILNIFKKDLDIKN